MSGKVKITSIEFATAEWECVRSLAQEKNKKAEIETLTPPNVLRLALGFAAKKRGGARPNTGNRRDKGSRKEINLNPDEIPF